MASTCSARLRELAEHIGDGELTASVVVDQAYAQDQHETMHYRHPHGGGPKYLERALFDGHRGYYSDLADVIHDEAHPLVDAMRSVGRDLVFDSAAITPVGPNGPFLARSHALTITDQGAEVYHDEPQQRRLTEEELEAINRTDGR